MIYEFLKIVSLLLHSSSLQCVSEQHLDEHMPLAPVKEAGDGAQAISHYQ